MGTHDNAFAAPPVVDHRPMSHAALSLDEDGLDVDDVFSFMANLENLAAWHPSVRGAVRWQHQVSPLVPDDRPVGVGTTYRLLFDPGPLADLMRCRVTTYEPPHLVEWRCQGTQRILRLAVCVTAPAADTVRVQVRWAWLWKGWRRVPGAARASHQAAYAVAASAKATLERCLEHLKRHSGVHAPPRQVAVTDVEDAAAPGS